MKRKDIAMLLDEPAAAHPKRAGSGCAGPKPGATAGGCAFDGARIALLPIADVAHIVHGSIACAGNSWDNRGTRSSGPALYKIGMTTDLTEQDVVMGRGEQRLLHAIEQAIHAYHPAAVFVYNTCIPALIGDDLEAVCKQAQSRWDTPVVPVDSAGFYGTKNLGNRLAGEAMVKYVCGGREPDPLPAGSERPGFKVHDVTLVDEYNIAGELWHVLPLLDELGLRVLCALAGDARLREVQTMHRSEVNMMVCSKAMLNVARKLEAAFGKVFFVRHWEPIPLQTTAMDQGSAVMGANENLVEGLRTLCSKNAPELIGVPTTGLAETQGTDIRMAVRMFRDRYPQFDAIPVVPVATTDFSGAMESGYALAVAAVIEQLVPRASTAGTRPGRRPRQVNVLARDVPFRPVRRRGPAGRFQRSVGIHGGDDGRRGGHSPPYEICAKEV